MFGKSNDDMGAIFEKEYQLQLKIYGKDWGNDFDEIIREYAMHLHVETVEMLQESNFKQKAKRPPTDMGKVQGEIVDVFLIALATASMSFASYDDFLDAIHRKMSHNNRRKDWELNNR